jgi:hypothetical protein
LPLKVDPGRLRNWPRMSASGWLTWVARPTKSGLNFEKTMRIETHPILEVRRAEPFSFFFSGKELLAYPGETIASALFANGIRIFGRPSQRWLAARDLLRQRPVRPMFGHGRWPAGEGLHDLGAAGNAGDPAFRPSQAPARPERTSRLGKSRKSKWRPW